MAHQSCYGRWLARDTGVLEKLVRHDAKVQVFVQTERVFSEVPWQKKVVLINPEIEWPNVKGLYLII
jgi:hypothetical protein